MVQKSLLGVCVEIISAPDQEHARDILDTILMQPGYFVEVKFPTRTKLYICCPGCSSSSFTGNHVITKEGEQYSANPSLQFKCCDWHGHLKNNKFTRC